METILEAVKHSRFFNEFGKVVSVKGVMIESIGPVACLGDICEIYTKNNKTIIAEVVGINEQKLILMPYKTIHGISYGDHVVCTGETASINVGPDLLGKVIDAFGEPLEDFDTPVSFNQNKLSIHTEPGNPLAKKKISEVFETGVKAIDSLLTIGKGQRLGIFSSSGVGKSTLLSMIVNNANSDINIIALIGERSREVSSFIQDILGRKGMEKSIVVVATCDQPALVRRQAAYLAMTLAEYFSGQGNDVLLTMDSITRFAMALREIGLSVGEMPAARGYTPSVFDSLPKLLERAGNNLSGGTITSLYTVLVEGDDIDNPLIDSLKSILDGHIFLSRELANSGHFPAIDMLSSISRLLNDIISKDEKQFVRKALSIINVYNKHKDMIEMGLYKQGSNKEIDQAISAMPRLSEFLMQEPNIFIPRDQSLNLLKKIINDKTV